MFPGVLTCCLLPSGGADQQLGRVVVRGDPVGDPYLVPAPASGASGRLRRHRPAGQLPLQLQRAAPSAASRLSAAPVPADAAVLETSPGAAARLHRDRRLPPAQRRRL